MNVVFDFGFFFSAMRCCCEKTLRKNGRLGTPHPKPAEGLLLLRRWNQDQGIEFNAPLLMNWRIEQEMIDFWLFWTIGDRFGPCRSILDWLEPFWHYFWPILDIFWHDGKPLLTVLNHIRGQPRLFLTILYGVVAQDQLFNPFLNFLGLNAHFFMGDTHFFCSDLILYLISHFLWKNWWRLWVKKRPFDPDNLTKAGFLGSIAHFFKSYIHFFPLN